MLYLTAKSKLTNEWLYINAPVQNVNVSEYCIDCKMLSGKWELLSNLYYSIMITNNPIKVVIDE
uniref:NEOGENIN, RGM DOMAIN FAMILY MEMBER ADHESION n=1 Tax=Tectiviridae sp. TaxID=2831614 RepID=A0A8S5VYB7_9VIRU|nr:MAG TPA: NEOGENIN, RGM DOMAIN FAMILY MEMBER ADHESION [Tectiviridae sp.]